MTPVEDATLRVGGRDVRVLHAGAGRPIVLVHGLGLGADVWRYHLAHVGAHYRVIAPDMPGFGSSGGPAFGFDVARAADWLARFASAYDIEDAIWVGHSVSAQHALRLAADQPRLARGLVLAAPTGEPGHLRWLAQLAGLARTAFREDVRLIRDVLRHYASTPPTRTIGTWIGARRHRPLDDIARLRCPVRVVLGGRDPVVPWSWGDLLVENAARATLVVIPDAAHGVALSPPAPFCAVVSEFADRIFAATQVDDPADARGRDGSGASKP